MKNQLLLILLLCIFAEVSAQEKFKGTVTDSNGNALQRSKVKVYNSHEVLLADLFTDEAGRFSTDIEIVALVTGLEDQLKEGEHLSFAYPNPIKSGPLYFKYRSSTKKHPTFTFTSFDGKTIRPGDYINAGAYVYRAAFSDDAGALVYSGVFYVLQPMTLRIELLDINSSKIPSITNSTSGARSMATKAESTVRIEIEKSGFISFNGEINLTQDGNADKTFNLQLAPPPVADFQILTEDGSNDGSLIIFDGSASTGANGEPLSFSWDFDDGSLGGQPKVPHIFAESGDYTITMTAIGAYGATKSISKNLTVAPNGDVTGLAAICGIVSDATGARLAGAKVYVPAMDSIFITNDQGEIGFDGFISGIKEVLEISKDGFITEYFPLKIESEAGQGYFEASLINREPAMLLSDIELGGKVTGKEGTSVNFPVEALVYADGTMVTGEVEVYMTPVDIANDTTINAFPGQFAGITPEGEAPLILSYGVADYTLMQDGKKLQLSPGKSAIIDIPIYMGKDEAGNELAVGTEYPLWSYNEKSGIWVQEGMGEVVASVASPTGLALRGEVMHFSWWNHDVAPDPWWAVPECETPLNDLGLPVLEIPKGGACYIDGEIEGSNGPRGRPSTPNCCTPLPCPPGVEILFSAKAGNGIYEGSIKKSGAAGATTTFSIPMQRIAGYGEIAGIIAPDTLFNTAIETADNIDAYTIKGKGHVGEEMLLFVGQASGSNLEGEVELRDPDNLLLYKSDFANGKSFQTLVEIKKEGDYQVIVSGTANAPGAYTVSLSSTEVIKLNTNTNSEWAFQREVKTFIVDLKKDQLFSVAVATEETSGSFFMRVYDPVEKRIFYKNSQGYMQTEIFKSSMDGIYRIEVEGISDNLNKFVLGLSSIKDPKSITLDDVLTSATDSMKIVGERKYYKIEGTTGERRQFNIHTWELKSNMSILKPEDKLFYERNSLTNVSTTNYNSDGNGAYSWGRTQIQTLPETGEYIIEVDGTMGYNVASGNWKYEIFVLKPEVKPISMNSQINDKDTAFYDWINEIKHYTFNGTAGELINVAYLQEKYSRSYLRLFDADMKLISSIRDGVELGVIKLPATGNYIIEYVGVDAVSSQGKYVIGLTSVELPKAIDLDSKLTAVTDSFKIVGKRKYYKIEGAATDRRQFTIHTWALKSNMYILNPGDKPFYERTRLTDAQTTNYNSDGNGAYSWGRTQITTLPTTGEYIIEVNGAMIFGLEQEEYKYEVFIHKPDTKTIALNSQINDETVAFFDWINEFKHYTFEGTAGDLVNVGYLEANPARNYLRLFDADMKQISSIRDGKELGVISLPSNGKYTIEFVGVDADRSQGKYVLGLTSVEPPVAINYQTPFTAINGTIDVVGKHRYYSLQVDSLERFNIGIFVADTAQAGLQFRKFSDKPFYDRPTFKTAIDAFEGKSAETGAFSMPTSGEIILEITPIRRNNMLLDNGGYQLYIGQRAIEPLALNTPTEVSYVKDLGQFKQFYRFRITAPASNKISISALPPSLGYPTQRVYISVHSMNGTQVYRQLLNDTGIISLPAAGDYIVDVENVYGNDELYTITVNEEL